MRAVAVALVVGACSSSPPVAPEPAAVGPITRPRIVAHRGASAAAPENTLAAFRRAWELGVECVELDVQLSRDGEAVVIHDPDTRRLAHVDREVADQTLVELQALDVGAGEHIPTIAQALATVPRGRTLFVEIKTAADTAPAVARAILAADPRPRGASVALQGIDADALAALARELPGMPAYWTAFPPTRDDQPLPYPREVVREAARRGFAGVALYVGSVTEDVLADAKRAGLLVDVWTLNDPPVLERALARDDLRWIETDRPELVPIR